MSRLVLISLLSLIASLWSNEISIEELIEIDVVVSVEVKGDKVLNVDLTKYTVDGKSVNIKLKGYDGVINAKLTPVVLDEGQLELTAGCEIRNFDGTLINKRDKVLKTNYDKKIIFYPLGGLNSEPKVLMELTIKKFAGL